MTCKLLNSVRRTSIWKEKVWNRIDRVILYFCTSMAQRCKFLSSRVLNITSFHHSLSYWIPAGINNIFRFTQRAISNRINKHLGSCSKDSRHSSNTNIFSCKFTHVSHHTFYVAFVGFLFEFCLFNFPQQPQKFSGVEFVRMQKFQ